MTKKRMLVWGVVAIVLLAGLGAIYGPQILGGRGRDKAEMRKRIKDDLTERIRRRIGGNASCVKVTLLRETKHKYAGLAEFSDGSQASVDVTVDGDQFMWRVHTWESGIPPSQVEPAARGSSRHSTREAVIQHNTDATLNAKAWQRFVNTYRQDDPFSTEDEGLRSRAGREFAGWQTKARTPRQQAASMKALRYLDTARRAIVKELEDGKDVPPNLLVIKALPGVGNPAADIPYKFTVEKDLSLAADPSDPESGLPSFYLELDGTARAESGGAEMGVGRSPVAGRFDERGWFVPVGAAGASEDAGTGENETLAVVKLRTYMGAQILFHRTDFYDKGWLVYANPKDGKGFPDLYQVGGVGVIKFIEEVFAKATSPAHSLEGYYFVDITKTSEGDEFKYWIDCGLCAVPAEYGRTGTNTFVIGLESACEVYMKDNGGKPVTTFPDVEKDGWIRVASD